MHQVSHRLFLYIIFTSWMLRWGTPTTQKSMRALDELEVRPSTPFPRVYTED